MKLAGSPPGDPLEYPGATDRPQQMRDATPPLVLLDESEMIQRSPGCMMEPLTTYSKRFETANGVSNAPALNGGSSSFAEDNVGQHTPHTPRTIFSTTNGARAMTAMTTDDSIDRARQLVVSGVGFGNRSSVDGSHSLWEDQSTSGGTQAASVWGDLDHAAKSGAHRAHEQHQLQKNERGRGVAPRATERHAGDCRVPGSEMYLDMY